MFFQLANFTKNSDDFGRKFNYLFENDTYDAKIFDGQIENLISLYPLDMKFNKILVNFDIFQYTFVLLFVNFIL